AGVEIVRRREQLGWSQARLAREMGISQTIVHRWESGEVAPDAGYVEQLERVFADGQQELPEGGAERLARVGERLGPLREQLGLSVSAMARRLGVDRGTYAVWEAGRRPVSSSRRHEILAAVDQLAAGLPHAGASTAR
ncbi:MAG: helix-turn-helix domain-containing protein, partial [Solirubrobacteraceae bacterium]